MKRFISLLLCTVLVFSICSCDKEENKTVKLTTANYSDYLHFDVYFSDFSFVETSEKNSLLLTTDMKTSFIVHIETSSKGNYTFEDVVINYDVTFNTRGLNYVSPTNIEIKYNGESHCSFIVTGEMAFSVTPTQLQLPKINNYRFSIRGNVTGPTVKVPPKSNITPLANASQKGS